MQSGRTCFTHDLHNVRGLEEAHTRWQVVLTANVISSDSEGAATYTHRRVTYGEKRSLDNGRQLAGG